jgi:CheY-like chemotaxis protein
MSNVPDTRFRILCVGVDMRLLNTRQALLDSRGYESWIATPADVDEKMSSGRFDVVILSFMLSELDKRRIKAKIPAETKLVALTGLIMPDDLLRTVAETLT